MRKNNKKKLIIIGVIIVIVTILVALGVIIIVRLNSETVKLNKLILENNGNEIQLENNKLKLWNKTIDDIKTNNKEIKIKTGNITANLNNDNIVANSEMNISIKENIINCNFDNLKNVSGVEIEVLNEENNNYVSSVEIKKNIKWQNVPIVDVYVINGENEVTYLKSIEVYEDEEYIDLELEEGFYKYILCYVPVMQINVSENSIEMNKNEEHKIGVSIYPEYSTIKYVHAKYNDEIIVLNSDGYIKAINSGDACVTFLAENDTVSKDVNIKVNAIAEDIWIEKDSVSLEEEKTYQINAKVLPEDALNKELLYTSENNEIAEVTPEGLVTAKKQGNTKIIIQTVAEPVMTREVNVKVNKKKEVKVTNNENKNVKNKTTGYTVESVPDTSYETTVGTYINGILLVNKNYTLPSDYAPRVNKEAWNKFNEMKQQAKSEGINLKIISGYRSYELQTKIYNRNVARCGEEEANTFSAKPRTV